MKNTDLFDIQHDLFKATKKPYKIYAELLDEGSQEQFLDILNEDYITYAALMPDAHKGYTMPIGGVCSTKGKIVPQFVGFDIGCGMCAYQTDFKKDELENVRTVIYDKIKEKIPLGFNVHPKNQSFESSLPLTDVASAALNSVGKKQLGTLGGGNHFIEIGHDEDDNVWIIVHSGSRGMGHKIASYYMMKAYLEFMEKNNPIESKMKLFKEEFIKEFHIKKADIKIHNPKGFDLSLEKSLNKASKKELAKLEKKFMQVDLDKLEGIYTLDIESISGKNYITDLNFALDFALSNRKQMILKINESINEALNKETVVDYSNEVKFINRNHNHAEFNSDLGEWIHRKGATHAEKGMRGVIPGNMRDGSFIVVGKGNKESLFSSSHGAGRIMSRKKAKDTFSLEKFEKDMKGICGTVDINTIDESPGAYKDIFEVIRQQEDLIDVLHHVKPLINVKDNSKNDYKSRKK